MIPKAFDYFDVRNFQEAILLGKYGEDAKILAGGQSLVPIMKLRLATPKVLIDIKPITGLRYIRESKPGLIEIGALTTYSQIESSNLIKQKIPILAETAAGIEDSQVRNRGTIGGSLAHGDPAADLPPTILALNAEIETTNAEGSGRIKAAEFFVDAFTTALKPNEILTAIHIPQHLPNTGSTFVKLAHVGGDFVIVGVAAVITLDSKGCCDNVSVVLGGIGPVPVRAKKAENTILGKPPSTSLIEDAGRQASDGVTPSSDIHASSNYKTDMVRVLTRRALADAVDRARGQ